MDVSVTDHTRVVFVTHTHTHTHTPPTDTKSANVRCLWDERDVLDLFLNWKEPK